MTPRSRICVVGSANIDLTFRTSRFPSPGETLTGRALHQGLGGKGANQAVAAARLGAEVTFISCTGRDGFGAEAIRQYQADGIRTDFIRQVDNQPTGTAAILVDDQAENCIIVIPGANQMLSETDIQSASSVIKRSDAVLCQLETPLAATIQAFQVARSAKKLTVLTPAPYQRLPDQLLHLCDLCIPNRTEICALVGHEVNNADDAIDAARLLQDRGVGSVAVTMGRCGAVIVESQGATYIPASQVDAIDTTGAGDAFSAALAVFYCEGLSLAEAARKASLVAAITVTRLGAHPAFPRRDEIGD